MAKKRIYYINHINNPKSQNEEACASFSHLETKFPSEGWEKKAHLETKFPSDE
ncbi:MAG: hypothetical protein UX02_C0002G0120 [Candidatus Moranbacteria bacterium GW2011_GWC1_45_18]|nr:MAG: hypothetical protein UT79_C0001G0341 [Candidatus Moranbacteria bacterium GW2011_GWC2_40_12]KKT33901.1 MAG: hypothetical protein UW19_C0004G0031 [Candidatus Moranbacteria bacterium GW2011_GWF2_44_10]KKT72261.1 MAG: hypothetical protein UW66_C0008G0010 [Candidatus Moranbacteria bacterium GW2011_GWF1_44_4]KKT99801.1 MAG: hypothetical protein UX02_C0002G0120 [Candidatus Moranbacteria bacterium GW2011_GWC1_45_18]